MAALTSDFLSINRGGTVGDGASGQYLIVSVQDLLDLIPASTIVSGDPGQLLTAGADGGAIITAAVIQENETVTGVGYNPTTQVFTYTDESGAPNDLDFSGLTTDLKVDSASIDASGLITFTVDDAGTATDFTLDLSAYVKGVTDSADGGGLVVETGGGNTTLSKTGWMSFGLAP